MSNDIGFAFALYLGNPCPETIEAVLVALEARPDLPINAEQTRKVLTDGIDQVKSMSANTPTAQAGTLMQRLMSKGRK